MRMRPETKTALVMGVVIAAGVGAMSAVFSSLDGAGPDPAAAGGAGGLPAKTGGAGLRAAPDLVGIAHYINTTPEELAERIDGSVVLYDIWTYSCVNCVRTLPFITAWDDKYADEGLLIIGVHSPEFEFEKDPKNVMLAVERHGIEYPVVLDNDMRTWDAFENRYWPRKYIADHEGHIRYDHIGEGKYRETERAIQQLLAERAASLGVAGASSPAGAAGSAATGPPPPLVDIEEFEHTAFRTPELYFGYKLAQFRNHLGSAEGFQPGRTVSYSEPDDVDLHKFYMTGDWKNRAESMELVSETGSIRLQYAAKEVNIVTDGDARLRITLDGGAVPDVEAGPGITAGGILEVSEPDIYNVISGDKAGTHLMEIDVAGRGFQIFTFTFG